MEIEKTEDRSLETGEERSHVTRKTEDRSPETGEERSHVTRKTEDRSPETEEEKSHVVTHNGIGQGIKVKRPAKIEGSVKSVRSVE